MNVLFVVIAPKSKEGTFTVRLPVVVGRSEEAKFRIQQDRVSRKHCEFFATDGEVFIRDLGSTNGTFLDDEQVETSRKRRVSSGAVIRVGSLAFRVEYPAEPGTQTVVARQADHDASDVTVGVKQTGDSEHLQVKHAVESVVDSDVPAQTLPEDGFQPDTENAAEAEDAVAEESAAVDVPAANPEHKKDASTKKPAGKGFDFLAAEPVAEAAAEESPAWPGEAAAADDGPADDEELGDFFKGLK